MSWEPLNLANLEDRPSMKPSLGALGLLYPGRRHVFSGMPESGKTIAAYIEIIAVARTGSRAILIDLEMGPWDARDRLRDLGATDTDFELIFYIEPTTSATPEIISTLIALDPTLVVIDAAAGAYELSQLDDNKRQDVEAFARLYVNAFWSAGIATVVIDHVGKAAEQGSRFAIGSERKIGGADVHLGFEASKLLRRGGTGLVKITIKKDRLGHLPPSAAGTLRLDSHPDTHAITWTLESTAAEDDSSTFRPTVLMERASQALQHHGAPISATQLAGLITGKKEWKFKAIQQLVTEGYASKADKAPRLISHVKTFYKDAPVPGSQPVPDGSRNQAVATGSPVPSPYKGEPEPGTTRNPVPPRAVPAEELERLEQLSHELGL